MLRTPSHDVRGQLRASVNPIFARHILAPRLGAFAARHPALRLTLVQQPDVGDLVAEGVDVAIRFGPQVQPGPSARLLLETRVLTVASPAYLDRRGRPATPADLTGHDCLQFLDPRTGRPFDWEFRRPAETVAVATAGALTLADVDTMVAACLAGAGVVQVLALGVERHLASGALVDLFPDWPGETDPLYAVRPSRRLAPARVETFIDFRMEIGRQAGDCATSEAAVDP